MKSNKKTENQKAIDNLIPAENLETSNSSKNSSNLPANVNNKDSKNNKNKRENGFVRFFKRIGRAFKGMVEEMKKVTWPTISATLKSTGVVLVFVVIFLVVLMAMDALFGFGFNSLIGIQG